MKVQKLLIILLIILSLVPAYAVNKWLQKTIQPRASLVRLVCYFLSCFALVFGYTFLLILLISLIFPFARN